MKTINKIVLVLLVANLMPLPAQAASDLKPDAFSVGNMYFGGGLNYNSYSEKGLSDKAVGYQFLVGYDIGMRVDQLKLLLEVGYLNTGEFEDTILGIPVKETVKGGWGAAVVSYGFSSKFDVLGRVGYASGDESGPIFGMGAGYWFTKNLALRGEVVVRDDVDSFQINVLFRP